MTPDQWKGIEELYYACLELPQPEQSQFLAHAGTSAEIRREVESLLAHRNQLSSFIDRPGDEVLDIDRQNPRETLVGRMIGHYQLIALIGAGGMGVVYRARDTRLERDVAVKVLPSEFSQNRERLIRYEREARLLASLNHPNIAAIYDVEESDGNRCLILEYVEGETLSDRLKRNRIPLAEASNICLRIAEALEAAHEQGIVHRDLKPRNVMIRTDGSVKVLDFGIAKMLATGATLSSRADDEVSRGLVLGTPSYMSPEQARRTSVDKRTDIWAFGCVLYELLTGRRAFQGETTTDTLATILEREPDWTAVPSSTPTRIQELLRRCLKKDDRLRLRDIGEARIALHEVQTENDENVPELPKAVVAQRFAWVAALAILVSLAAAILWAVHPVAQSPELRVEISTPSTTGWTTDLMSFAISPDGRNLVFVASGNGPSRLWLRPLDSQTAQPLTGTETAILPFWSPDSRSIGFFSESGLKRVDIGGGPPQTLASAVNPGGGAWSPDGVILFGPGGPVTGPANQRAPLFRISAAGGEPVAVTKLDPSQISHLFPHFLPDGQQFLFYVPGQEDVKGIYLGSLDKAETRRLISADTAGFYAQGWLFYVRQNSLLARHFDISRGELTGDPLTVANPVRVDPRTLAGAFSISASGLLAYRSGGAVRRQLAWFDRTGRALGTVGPPDENELLNPSISPDGKRVAVERLEADREIWLLDGERRTRFTFNKANDRLPIWSPDGNRIAFFSAREGPATLYEQPSQGGTERLLEGAEERQYPTSWSRDGRFLAYSQLPNKSNKEKGIHLGVLTMTGVRKSVLFLNENFQAGGGQFSPDGRWMAYHSDESGRFEIYVRPFPGPGGQWQISTAGGEAPRWRADGRELYYVADGKLMAVPVRTHGAMFESGEPAPLFSPRIASNRESPAPQYDVAPDGRFLINVTLEDAVTPPIMLIQNWRPR